MKANNRIRGIVIFLIILVSIVIGSVQLSIPKVNKTGASGKNFSVEQAMKDLKYISEEKHPVGSQWHINVENYITNEISIMNMKYEIQRANVNDYNIENILVRIKGTESKNTILFMAHYDTANDTYGAGNNSLGTVTLLEIMRNITKQPKPKNDIIFFFTDGEEKGMLGSKLFAAEHPWSKDVDLAFNCEGMDAGPVVIMETSKNSHWMVKEVKKAIGSPVGYSLMADMFSLTFKKQVNNEGYNADAKISQTPSTKTVTLKFGTDLKSLKDKGIEGITLSPVKNFYNYSSELDSYSNVDIRTLNRNLEIVNALIKHFGNISIDTNSAGNATFFNVTKAMMVIYSSKFVVPISIVITLIFALIMWTGLRKKIVTIKGVLKSFLCVILMLAVAIAGVNFINTIIRKVILNISYNKVESAKLMIEFGKYYFLALVSLVISFGSYVFGKLLKSIKIYDLMAGVSVLFVLESIATSIFYKNGNYIIAWPTLFSLLGIGYMIWYKKEELKFHEFIPISILMIVPDILLIYPLISLYFDEAVSLGMVSILMGLMLGGLSLVIPYLYWNFKEKVSDLSLIIGMSSILMFVVGGMACLI